MGADSDLLVYFSISIYLCITRKGFEVTEIIIYSFQYSN